MMRLAHIFALEIISGARCKRVALCCEMFALARNRKKKSVAQSKLHSPYDAEPPSVERSRCGESIFEVPIAPRGPERP